MELRAHSVFKQRMKARTHFRNYLLMHYLCAKAAAYRALCGVLAQTDAWDSNGTTDVTLPAQQSQGIRWTKLLVN